MTNIQEEPEPNNTEQVEKEKKRNKWKTILGISFIILGLVLVFLITRLDDSCSRPGSVGITVLLIPSFILLIVGLVLVTKPTLSDRVMAILLIIFLTSTLIVVGMLFLYTVVTFSPFSCYPSVDTSIPSTTIEPVS